MMWVIRLSFKALPPGDGLGGAVSRLKQNSPTFPTFGRCEIHKNPTFSRKSIQKSKM